MKISCLAPAIACLLCASTAYAADSGEVISLDARHAHADFRPNEVIVKFKTGSRAKVRASKAAGVRSGVNAVDDVFKAIGAKNAEQLMPLTGAETYTRKMRAYNGREVEAPSLANAYLIEIADNKSVTEAVSMLAEVADIEYAEPNYLVHALDAAEDINDPYYELQYGIADINLFKLWGQPVTTKESTVIAIIDTGVDIMHPDLKANIWTNPGEKGGATGYDDDRNGFVDDLHGWDFVNQTGVMADYNGHGTHCAGIAGAVGHNGLGIIGANPNASIMPLTALQSNGQGDMATLVKAVDYAVANGARVISMSLGSYAHSIALEQALARAYHKCVIVAAAGNDGACLNHAHPERGQMVPKPMFPAAFTFVLGVQASNAGGSIADFSNYDDDGPVYSAYGEEKLYNYELTAPGAGIMSTYPNGQYKRLNGTSMATPLVAGAVSRLLQSKNYDNHETLFVDLINSNKGGVVDVYAAYCTKDGDHTPQLQFVGNRMADADEDGRPDAGEVLEFYPVIRNTAGTARNIKLTLDCAEEANTFCEILNGEADFGSVLSAYGKGESVNPLRIRINDNVVDGRVCLLKLTATCDNAAPIEQEFAIKVENGVELGGVLGKDMTLYADKHYIVTSAFGVPRGVTLTIEPGTTVKFKDNTSIQVDGNLIAEGEPGKMITFTKADLDAGYVKSFKTGNHNTLKYCIIENIIITGDCEFRFNSENSIVRNIEGTQSILFYGCVGVKNNIYNIKSSLVQHLNGPLELLNGNITNVTQTFNGGASCNVSGKYLKNCNAFSNYWGDEKMSLAFYSNSVTNYTPEQPNYLGTADRKRARASVVDINSPESQSFGEYDLSNMLLRPSAEAHGIVWKVVVDGFDAQDEYDLLPPLGVGRHKFEVYFNRPMDKSVKPMVAMGIRPPYTQHAIAEQGSWNAAGDIYTAWFTVTGKQDIDGINRIYVADAQDDEFFEIPIENTRFNVNVQAAGSLSTGFFGEAGLGRVNLEWEDLDMNIEDIMGYNMYRIEPETPHFVYDSYGNKVWDSEINDYKTELRSDTVQINRSLIDAGTTVYTDYDVTPGNTYRYYYKVMTTDLKENSPSKVIAVTPLTATQGDANGSGSVDVADVLTTVNYASGLNPKPFIFEAADMNADSEIDILDVVGIVNAIMGQPDRSMIQALQEARLWIEDGVLYIDTPVGLAGVQFDFGLVAGKGITVLDALKGFETVGSWVGDEAYRFMAYNFNGTTIPAGKHALLAIGDASVTDARLSDVHGTNVDVVIKDASGVDMVDKDSHKIENALPGVYNMLGVKVGESQKDLDRLPGGVYIVNGWKVVKK